MNAAFIMIPLNVLTFTKLIIIEHVSEIFLIALVDQSTNTYSRFLQLLSLSHANVAPERRFSINKHLSIHGNSINEETIVAPRLVKDHLFKVDGPTKITLKLLASVKNSFQRCNADLEAKREYRERIEKEKTREKQRLRKITAR